MRRHWRTFLLLTLLASVALPAGTAAAQPGHQIWLRLAHPSADKAVSPSWHEAVAVARSGDVYVAGSQATASGEDEDFLVARYGADGTHKWTKTYDHGKAEVVTDVAVDRLGNVVVCGREGGYDGFLVVKMSRSGALLWVRRIAGAGGVDGAEEIAIDATGSVYVVGTANDCLCLVKYSSTGRRIWLRTYPKSEIASELALGPDGRLYVGMNQPEMTEGSQLYIACYTTDGKRVWLRTIGTPRDVSDWIMDLDVRRSGVCGTGQSSRDGSTDGFVFRLRLDGTTKYWHPVNGSDGAPSASFQGCGMDAYGRVSVSGWSGMDFVVRRYRSNGTLQNASAWHGTQANDIAQAIVVTDAGQAYATGKTRNVDTGEDMLTVGFGPSWEPLFVVSHGSPTYGHDAGGDIALGTGCVYVVGYSDGDLVLIKYER